MNSLRFHEPVMVEKVLSYALGIRMNVFVDCTLGDGGHTLEILRATRDTLVIGIDIDREAVAAARERLTSSGFPGRAVVLREDYRNLPHVLARLGVPRIDAAIFDLGVSSRHLDDPQRGFTYKGDAPLDMRMNPDSPKTARDIIMNSSEAELERIIREYGEERFSQKIARAIVERRSVKPIETASDLVEVILKAIPGRFRGGRLHPARRTFQALRIATNDEISKLGNSLQNAFYLLNPGGKLMVISYHSLEDRVVKGLFRELEKTGNARVLTKKPDRPSEAEVARNPRSRSAKMRVIERRDLSW
ncbi:MAG TPA: 16S rRNA (cytosine(1402)-N(4))-methyltransferase RsmH [Firmicutes bacterium]|nr:16S rRNA (cytosine(1402)-N(4))-methyltransferase RsmH [Candidatus Fermentithermobacillaceae bacterium]